MLVAHDTPKEVRIEEIELLTRKQQAEYIRATALNIAEGVFGEQIEDVPLWEVFDSLAFLQFRSELHTAFPMAEGALDFEAKDNPTMQTIVERILARIPDAAEEVEEAASGSYHSRGISELVSLDTPGHLPDGKSGEK